MSLKTGKKTGCHVLALISGAEVLNLSLCLCRYRCLIAIPGHILLKVSLIQTFNLSLTFHTLETNAERTVIHFAILPRFFHILNLGCIRITALEKIYMRWKHFTKHIKNSSSESDRLFALTMTCI